MKQMLEQEQLGRILQFRIGFFHASSVNPDSPFKWKHSETGGVILDLASHVLDMTDYLLGPFDSLIATTQIAWPERPLAAAASAGLAAEMVPVCVEDAVSILAKMVSGANGVIEATKLATGSEDEMRVEIHGTKGAVRFNLMNPHYLEYFDATASDKPNGGNYGWLQIACGGRYEPPHTDFPYPKGTTGWARAHVAALSNFLAAVAAGKQTSPDIQQGAKIQRIMDIVRTSHGGILGVRS
ncbi:MAG: Gfo/Idh/MocA family protein, partial [Thermoguttaceae bacterium]